MKKVEIYDQFSAVYKNTNNEFITVNLMPNQTLDQTLTLIHEANGFSTLEGENLTDNEANNLVASLYEQSKQLGVSYIDKIIKLNEGYAELKIFFEDGKVLNRVIYSV